MGNATGCWTFGEMIKNIANEGATNVSAKELLKVWLNDWMNDETINMPYNPLTGSTTTTLYGRKDIANQLIIPWLCRAIYENSHVLNGILDYNSTSGTGAAVFFTNYYKDGQGQLILNSNGEPTFTQDAMVHHLIDIDGNIINWEPIWDQIPEQVLLKYAPFRLMAISNRIDLRNNNIFQRMNTQYKGGETRFIYTLVNVTGNSNEIGGIPIHLNSNNSNTEFNFADWEGMNVILEYGNSSTSICQERALAQEWANLSNMSNNAYPSFPLPPANASNYSAEFQKSQTFNAALQNITNKVTKANADPRRSGNNYSAINQIRTNEKIFDKVIGKMDKFWNAGNWELRQFQINSNHLLKRVDVANVPFNNFIDNNDLSKIYSLNTFNASNILNFDIITTLVNQPYNYSDMNYNLWDWTTNFNSGNNQISKGRMASVISENHQIPYFTGTQTVFAAPSAILEDERYTYFDIWKTPAQSINTDDVLRKGKVSGLKNSLANVVPNKISNGSYTTDEDVAKYLRHGLSIQTCQGCHGGDTKTMFTMIHPQGYGKTAIYWNGVPDYLTRNIDNRFEFNEGKTGLQDNSPRGTNTVIANGAQVQTPTYIPVVSSFLTGIAINGQTNTSNPTPLSTFDDFTYGVDDIQDQNYNVNDYSTTLYGANKFWVNDPSNQNTNPFLNSTITPTRFGYNELDRRRTDLCDLLHQPCTISELWSTTIQIIKDVKPHIHF